MVVAGTMVPTGSSLVAYNRHTHKTAGNYRTHSFKAYVLVCSGSSTHTHTHTHTRTHAHQRADRHRHTHTRN